MARPKKLCANSLTASADGGVADAPLAQMPVQSAEHVVEQGLCELLRPGRPSTAGGAAAGSRAGRSQSRACRRDCPVIRRSA